MAKSSTISENEQVELVFLKFGLAQTDDEFESLVDKFLPYTLQKLSSKDENIRKKVIELLNHISNRLKSRPEVKLPIGKLLELYKQSSSAFIVNFTIVYVKLGYPRLSKEDQGTLAPQLFCSMEGKPKLHQNAILRLLVSAFPHVKLPENPLMLMDLFRFKDSPSSLKLLLDFCLDVLLMPYSALSPSTVPARPSTAPPGREAASAPAPAGLSMDGAKRLIGDSEWSYAQIEEFKAGMIALIGGDVFPEKDIVTHLIVASSDTRHSVSSAADMELRKRHRSLNWDAPTLVTSLYRLYLGDAQTLSQAQRKQKPLPSALRAPVELRVKLKIVQNLLRSKLATERFPYTVQLVYGALFGTNYSSKLQTLGLDFVHHMCERCDVSKLLPQAPLLLDAMIKISKEFEKQPKLQGLAYTAMGKLSLKVPTLFTPNLKLLQDAFDAMSKECPQELKLYIQESLAMMSTTYKNVKKENLPLLEAIINQYIGVEDHLCRLSAVRYAGVIFSADHVNSRYLLLLAASDAREDVASEAKKSLYGVDASENTANSGEGKKKMKMPSFRSMLNFVSAKAQERMKSSKRYVIGVQSIAFPPTTYSVMLQFFRKCLLQDACDLIDCSSIVPGEKITEAPVIADYIKEKYKEDKEGTMSLLEKYLKLIIEYTRTVIDSDAVYILLETVAICPQEIPLESLLGEDLESKKLWLKSLTHHTKQAVREFGTELHSIILQRTLLNETCQQEAIAELKIDASSNKSFEKKHGSLLVLGYLLGAWLPNYDQMVPDIMKGAFVVLLVNATSSDTTIACAACSAIGEVVRKTSIPLPDEPPEIKLPDDHPLRFCHPAKKGDVMTKLMGHITSSSAHKLREKSVIALGYIPVGDPTFPNLKELLDGLLESAEIKEPDLHFTVARALCNVALGPNSAAGRNKWHREKEFKKSASNFEDKLPWLVERILDEYVTHRIPAVRQAASIWLLTMLKTPEFSSHHAIKSYLPKIQSAFMTLLAETDDLVQDVASKGLGVVYELGSHDQKKLLVDALVASLMEGNSSKSAKPNQENLFHGVKGVGKAPDGSNLSTYKEICSLASDLNQPDLVYKFMHLAKHHALWNSKKGAAFGFSSIANLANEQLAPHLPRIVPRLYRYTFDPYTGVRTSMTSIWNALAPDSKKLIDEYLGQITEDLQKNLESSLWRTRQASCLAVADLLRGGRGMQGGKEGDIIIGALPRLWIATLRVMDDIKETVRDAATVACAALAKATVRLCDHDQGKRGEKAVAGILPVLLDHGLKSRVKEVRASSLSTLVEVSKKSGKLIKICIPEMVVALLEALSEFEPSELNYLAVRSDQDSREAIDLVRAEYVKSSPMVVTIDRVLQYSDKDTLEKLVPSLTDIAKKNYGIMTKAGCSHVVVTLASQCPQDLSCFASTIMSSFTSGLLDNSLAIRKCNAEAVGHLAAIAKDTTVTKLLTKLKGWYLEKEDDIHRHASAITCHSIGKHSPDVLKAHATTALPLAFLGMHETAVDKNGKKEENINSVNARKEDKNSTRYLWNDLWTEFTPGIASAIKLYLDELISFTSAALQSPRWKMKAQAAAAMAFIARQQREGTIAGLQLKKLLEVLMLGLQGRTWDGKEKLLIALSAVAVHCKSQLSMEEITFVLSLLFKDCNREKIGYKTEAIHSFAAVLEAHRFDKFGHFWEILFPILKKDSKGSDSESDDDDVTNKKNISDAKLKLLEYAVEATGRAWPRDHATQDEYFEQVSKVLSEHIALSTWNIQLTALRSIKLIFRGILESTDENMDVNQEEERTRAMNVKENELLKVICTSLGNAKYSRIREEAFAIVQVIVKMYEKGILRCYGVDEMMDALQNSPLAHKSSIKKSAADDLLKKLSCLDKREE